jgi:general secretion pathway protein G
MPGHCTSSPSERTEERQVSTRREAGFTLIELIIVVTIIGVLATIALPAMSKAPLRAKESVLREDLYQMRSCIDQYLADHGEYPGSLEELIEAGYLRKIPVDPITESDTTWVTEQVDPETDEDLQPTDGPGGGIIDVFSGSEKQALDGSYYRDW